MKGGGLIAIYCYSRCSSSNILRVASNKTSNELFYFKQYVAMLSPMLNDILTDARARLRSQPKSMIRISEETGLTYSWLTKFSDGRITNPTIRTLHQLIEYLDKNPNEPSKDRAV